MLSSYWFFAKTLPGAKSLAQAGPRRENPDFALPGMPVTLAKREPA